MEPSPRCAFCQGTSPAPCFRPLVPALFFEEGIFSVDPLGSAGAGLELCPRCAQILSSPMLLAEDAAAFASAVALCQRGHPPGAAEDAVADRARLWHRALHLGLRALVSELEAASVKDAPQGEPGQLDLFSSRTARLSKLETAIAQGSLPAAAARAAEVASSYSIPEAAYLAGCLPQLAARLDALALEPERLAEEVETPGALFDASKLTGGLAEALARHLALRVAEAAERRGCLAVRGRPTGWFWLRAAEPARARAALEAAAAQGVLVGRAFSLLGDLERAEGREQAARELYRRAFCEDPLGVEAEALADEALRALVEEARELELAPPEVWVPIVGWALGLFGLPSEPQGQGACRDFHAALLSARRGGGVAARRRMKELAPLLFERLRDGGRL
jgi:tetratricopeptide (TPR) repeat protein